MGLDLVLTDLKMAEMGGMELLARARERTGKHVERFSEDARHLLEQFDWPGNVRQLDATMERAAIACDGDVIEPRHLPRTISRQTLP
jgi:DNA-binding NtrC family response regulator